LKPFFGSILHFFDKYLKEDTEKKVDPNLKKTNVFQEEDRCAVPIMELIAKTV
jgi:hypothetical protein